MYICIKINKNTRGLVSHYFFLLKHHTHSPQRTNFSWGEVAWVCCGQGGELRAGAQWQGLGQDRPVGHSASLASTRLALTSTYGQKLSWPLFFQQPSGLKDSLQVPAFTWPGGRSPGQRQSRWVFVTGERWGAAEPSRPVSHGSGAQWPESDLGEQGLDVSAAGQCPGPGLYCLTVLRESQRRKGHCPQGITQKKRERTCPSLVP